MRTQAAWISTPVEFVQYRIVREDLKYYLFVVDRFGLAFGEEVSIPSLRSKVAELKHKQSPRKWARSIEESESSILYARLNNYIKRN